ncbi:MAG: hypothetical protein JW774_08725, partial [Candidatus Aureabacteria bacterium]|nr:hypothetical protein [Candidatus Auribacterota bacterium]
MLSMTSSIPKFSIQNRPSAFIFSILLSLSLFYPYFSYDPVLSPLICLLSVVFAIILSFKHPNASSIQWGLLYLLFMSLGFWNMDSAALSNKSIILLITRVSFFYSSSILCDSESNKKIIISILMGLGTVISLYGLWQYIHIFPASLKFYSQFHEFIPDEIKHDPGKWKAFWV